MFAPSIAFIDLETKGTGADAQEFVNALTTNLTRFWREEHHFAHLIGHIGDLMKARTIIFILTAANRMDDPARERILTTDYVRDTQPDLLPWKHPALKAVHDLVKGHGWTGGFRSRSVYCVDVTARSAG